MSTASAPGRSSRGAAARRLRTLWPYSYLVTLPLWPFVAFKAAVGGEPIPDGRLALYAAVAAAAVLLPTALLRALRWRWWLATGSVLAVAVVLFFNYDLLWTATKAIHLGRTRYGLVVWLIALAAASVATWRLAPRPGAGQALSLVGAVALGVAAVQIPMGALTRSSPPAVHLPPLDVTLAPGPRPDIYLLWVDGYAGQDALQQFLAFDNTPFVRQLQARGLDVVPHAISNYDFTIASIGSTLDLAFLLDVDHGADFSAEHARAAMAGDSRFVQALRDGGYDYLHYASTDLLFRCDKVTAEVCIQKPQPLSTFDEAVLDRTPLRFPTLGVLLQLVVPRDRLVGIVGRGDALPYLTEHLPPKPSVAPRLAYAHVVVPHAPMTMTADCALRPLAELIVPNGWSDRAGYIQQLQCTNIQVLALIDRMLEISPNAIIVVQSDHGSFTRGQAARPPSQWTADDILEKHSILLAYRLPEGCRGLPYPGMSSINTLAVVLQCLGARVPLQPDRLLSPAS